MARVLISEQLAMIVFAGGHQFILKLNLNLYCSYEQCFKHSQFRTAAILLICSTSSIVRVLKVGGLWTLGSNV